MFYIIQNYLKKWVDMFFFFFSYEDLYFVFSLQVIQKQEA